MIMITFGCQPDPDEYSRPKELVGTIYPQLEALGEFEYYLKCLDKTEYAEPLKKGGAWTVFVPTDKAFEEFMAEEGYSSFEEIPIYRIKSLIQYTLLSGGHNTTALSYDNGWTVGKGFRRVTQYRDSAVVVNSNDYIGFEDAIPNTEYIVDESSGRSKTIHCLLPEFTDNPDVPLEYTDYDFMFPNRTKDIVYGDMKVFEAHTERENVVAENGFIHVLDKVIEPRKNLYQNLYSDEYKTDEYPEGKYSIFRSILNRFGTFNDRGADDVINEETGVLEKRYYTTFDIGIDNNGFAFNLADENSSSQLIPGGGANNFWKYAPGLTVPTNDAFEAYLAEDNILGNLYDSYDQMPIDVLAKFINVNSFDHFWSLCPSLQGSVFSSTKDQLDYNMNDVEDVNFCSNGLFVGVNRVFERTSFSTIVGPMLLEPEYTIMYDAIFGLGIESSLQSQGIDFTVLGVKNSQFINVEDPNNELRKVTISVNIVGDTREYSMLVTGDVDPSVNRLYVSTESLDNTYIKSTIQSIVNNQIIEGPIVLGSKDYYQTRTGEFVYVGEGNRISGGGDIFNGKEVLVENERTFTNGKFYDMSSFIERPVHYVYGALKNATTDFTSFINVLEGAGVFIETFKNPDDRLLNLVASTRNYTLLAPTNEAIQMAVDARNADLDPSDGLDGIPDPDPAYLATLSELDRAIATRDLREFAQRHFIQDPIPTNGKKSGVFRTLYVKEVINLVSIYQEYEIENNGVNSSLSIKNLETDEVITTGELTNLLSKKIIIHEIENYLK